VALAGENTIAVIETSTHEMLGQVHLRSGDAPTELALSASGKTLLALNRQSHSVSIIETDSLSERGRIRLDSEANDIVMGNDEQTAYAIHSAASVVSVLYLDSLTVRTSSIFENSLLTGAISADGTLLYLVTDFSPELLIIDTASLTMQNKIFIGSGARAIKRNRVNGLLYVGKQDGGIAVVDPRALMAIDSFQLPGPVQALAIDHAESALFALLSDSSRLLKLDLISKQTTGIVEVDAKSHAVVVMGER
ncbi:MAG: hypothetical protein IBX47_05005, partial [Desulfuromonadales bacterium]|nr:hypothetical protein [Desulfuromonadales bacterium]